MQEKKGNTEERKVEIASETNKMKLKAWEVWKTIRHCLNTGHQFLFEKMPCCSVVGMANIIFAFSSERPDKTSSAASPAFLQPMYSWPSIAKKKVVREAGGGGRRIRMDKVGRKQRKTTLIKSPCWSVRNKQLYHQESNEIVLLRITASISKTKRMRKMELRKKTGEIKKVEIASETKQIDACEVLKIFGTLNTGHQYFPRKCLAAQLLEWLTSYLHSARNDLTKRHRWQANGLAANVLLAIIRQKKKWHKA